jgi:hypothetical protein
LPALAHAKRDDGTQVPPHAADKPYEVDARDRLAMHGAVDAESIARFVSGRTGGL